MTGLTVQNFLSAATGIAVVFARQGVKTLGNAWIDIARITLYLLPPLAIIFALFLVSQCVIQNFSPYLLLLVETLQNQPQTIPMGLVASQEAIKLLGTNRRIFCHKFSSSF